MAEGSTKLSEEELYECLKSLSVPTRIADIQTPTKEFLFRVYDCFLKDLQIDITHHNLGSFLAIKHIEYPEIYVDGKSVILLIMFINLITNADNVTIYARDIIFPKPKRTKKILNYLIVFWRYFLMKYASFKSLAEKFEEERKEANKLLEENDRLEMKYNECLSTIKNELPSKEELISCNASKAEKCKEMEKQREILAEEYNVLKKREIELQTVTTTSDVNIVSTKEQIKELEELILTSPEKLSTEIKKLKDSIREEEIKIKEKEIELKDKKRTFDTLKQVLESDAKDLEELKNVNKALQTFEDIVKNLVLDLQTSQEEKEILKRLESELQIKEELQSMNEHKSAKIHLHYKKQKESYNETLQMLQRTLAQEQNELVRLKADNSELEQKMDKEVDIITETIERCKEAEKTTQKLQIDYKSQMESIASTFVSQCGNIKSHIAKKYGE